MSQDSMTQVSRFKIRQHHHPQIESTDKNAPQADWQTHPQKKTDDGFLRNLSVAAALVICAVTLRTGVLPELKQTSDIIMTAATDQSLLDDQLGKLSFVSSLFPEAVLVFGEERSPQLSTPVSDGSIVHTWSEQEPYMSWRTGSQLVSATAGGEVSGVYHGAGDEWLVEVVGDNGMSYLYGNLGCVDVHTGDSVASGAIIGQLLPDSDFVFEVFRNGNSIDPTSFFVK